MVLWTLALIGAVVLFFVAPVVLGALLLLCFAVVCLGNAYSVWMNMRRKEHHSTVPLIGATCGAIGLWLTASNIELLAPRLWRAWYLLLPFVLDVGTLMLLAWTAVLVSSAVRTRLGR